MSEFSGVFANWTWTLDGWIIVIGALCACSATLLGNFLVLRKMSMLGDAISHAVLPGLAAAFFLSDSRQSLPMFLGAVLVGILTAMFTEWIRGYGKVDEGASMGVVFTSLFALGLVMIVRAADHVDLDPGCVLYGAIELTPLDVVTVGGMAIPQAALTLGIVFLVNTLFVILFFKELKISSFDPALATTTGFNARLIHYGLMVLVAVTAVASFEAVGNILVVAMFVVPAATAYMLTDRLAPMIWISLVIACCSAVTGHWAATEIPTWFGYRSTGTAGMMAVAVGAFLMLAVVFSPRHGVVVKFVRRQILSWSILADDVVALLFRIHERGDKAAATFANFQDILFARPWSLSLVLKWLQRKKQVAEMDGHYELTSKGLARASELVRSHRLWEKYLVESAGLDTGRIHDKAERFEHFTDQALLEKLDEVTETPSIDPHGAPIPRPHSDEN